MTTAPRCEPPPELRDRDGWHWLTRPPFYPAPVPWFWLADIRCWLADIGGRFNTTMSDCPDDVKMAKRGVHYHAPIPDPPAEPYQSPRKETE